MHAFPWIPHVVGTLLDECNAVGKERKGKEITPPFARRLQAGMYVCGREALDKALDKALG